jgi:hypothetical protein
MQARQLVVDEIAQRCGERITRRKWDGGWSAHALRRQNESRDSAVECRIGRASRTTKNAFELKD